MTVVLSLATVICAVGWLKGYISNAVLLWYLTEKGFPLPSEDEIKEGSRWVAKHFMKDLTCRR